jgi:hypothetical protein
MYDFGNIHVGSHLLLDAVLLVLVCAAKACCSTAKEMSLFVHSSCFMDGRVPVGATQHTKPVGNWLGLAVPIMHHLRFLVARFMP